MDADVTQRKIRRDVLYGRDGIKKGVEKNDS